MRTELSHWWRSFLGIGDEARRTALDILRQRYLDETEHAELFNQHARQMHYSQFRKTLLCIAAAETEHAELSLCRRGARRVLAAAAERRYSHNRYNT